MIDEVLMRRPEYLTLPLTPPNPILKWPEFILKRLSKRSARLSYFAFRKL